MLTNSEVFKQNIKVAVIQGNIDPYLKWDASFIQRNFAIYDSLSSIAGEQYLDLIVWPETATAWVLPISTNNLTKMRDLTDSLNVSILTGSPDGQYFEDGRFESYNGLLFFQPHIRKVQSYWKIHLVPFGERVPFEDSIQYFHDFLESLNMGTGDFAPGKDLKIFEKNHKNEVLPFVGIICFESIFPDLVRSLIKKGGKFLVIVTNDAWFGNTSGPYQHAQIAVFRAIENRISIARCANTGISSFVDPFGRVLSETKYGEQTLLISTVPIRETTTFYTRFGDVFSYITITVTVFGLCLALIRRS